LEPSFGTLALLVQKHTMHFPFQNYDLVLKQDVSLDFDLESVFDRVVNKKLGGMCYDNSEFFYYVLKRFNFQVDKVSAVVLNGREVAEDFLTTHNFLIVCINDNYYLVDVSFGFISLRFPLPIDFQKPLEEFIFFPNEKYQFLSMGNNYFLNRWYENEWRTMYRFIRKEITPISELFTQTEENEYKITKDIKFSKRDKPYQVCLNTKEQYNNLLTSKEKINVRDAFILIGGITENQNRVGYYYSIKTKEFKKYVTPYVIGEEVITLLSFEEVRDDVFKIFGLQIPNLTNLKLS